MPLDNQFDTYWYEHQSNYLRRATWTIARPLWPRFDALSRKLLWLKPAMKGVRIITGPGTPVIETYWVDPEEYLMYKLKYNI